MKILLKNLFKDSTTPWIIKVAQLLPEGQENPIKIYVFYKPQILDGKSKLYALELSNLFCKFKYKWKEN